MKYFATKEQATLYAKENGGFVCKMENHDIYVVLPTDGNDDDEWSIIKRTFEVKKKDSTLKASSWFPMFLLTQNGKLSLFTVPTSINGVNDDAWRNFLAVMSLSSYVISNNDKQDCIPYILCNGLIPNECKNYYVFYDSEFEILQLYRNDDKSLVARVKKPEYGHPDCYRPEVSLKPWATLCMALNKDIEDKKPKTETANKEHDLKKDILSAMEAFWNNIKTYLETTEDLDKTEMFDSIDAFAHTMKKGIENVTPKGQKTLF